MSENNMSLLPDIITPVSNAIHQNIPETEQQADGALSTVVGFFNNVVLYPVKKANMTYRYKLEAFEEDLKKKLEEVPQDNLQVPPTYIAGPILESLRYAYDEEELREMYEAMLSSAMDDRKAHKVHRSYVDAVSQMEPLDAVVLQEIYKMNGLVSAHINFNKACTKQRYVNAMPYHYCPDLCDVGDPFQVSSSISNLLRLGLLITNIGFLDDTEQQQLKNDEYIMSRTTIYKKVGLEIDIDVEVECQLISLDSYGRNFVDICIGREGRIDAD